jgi:putative membrane protein
MKQFLTRWNSSIRLFFTGFSMGAADIVPGVSGGTIAFILGIYEELMESIKVLSGEVPRLILQGNFTEAWKKIPFGFLIPLALGLGTAVLTLSSVLAYLLDSQPVYIWSFFFGLVLASIVLVSKRIVSWDAHDIVLGLVGAAIAYIVVGLVPIETPANPVAFFLAGFIAICAMILPGISGSFLLLIMGKYEQILLAVNEKDILTLGLVACGAVVGLAVFSRVLSWLFAKHHDVVIALLTGFMIGSLRKVWPWKEVLQTRLTSHGVEEALVTANIFPPKVDLAVVFALILATTGVAFIFILSKASLTTEVVSDISNPEFEKAHKKSLRSQKHT